MEDIMSTVEKLSIACCNGQMDIIDSSLKLGVNFNVMFNGELPLHLACRNTEAWTLDVVTKLLTNGADVDLEDDHGWNALDYALNTVPFQSHVAQLLLDCSKNGVNRLDPECYNYLWTSGSLEALKFLVENGIDVNYVNHEVENETYLDSLTALVYVRNPKVDEINYLRSVGAKLYSEL